PRPDRRTRRRTQTQAEILDIALQVMAEDGAAALSLSAVARRLGIQPPSLYKYFPSRTAVYDELFRTGQQRYLDTARTAAATAPPGLPGFTPVLDACGRWAAANPVLAQLLFWRPVPGFTPTPAAYAPALQLADLWRTLTTTAVDRRELHPDAATDDGLALLTILIGGAISQHLANDPHTPYDQGRYTRHIHRLPALFAAAYPPPSTP
uniref:TetR/AcrR family transcriptional regulator n=1 Tax=Nocardiopsis trehalosi TaxID=109329 RepID=UPI00082DDF47